MILGESILLKASQMSKPRKSPLWSCITLAIFQSHLLLVLAMPALIVEAPAQLARDQGLRELQLVENATPPLFMCVLTNHNLLLVLAIEAAVGHTR